jgi:hypothetical protein
MSCSYAKGAWEVRWRDTAGRQRSKRFKDEAAARAFDGAIRDQATGERDKGRHGQAGGVYPCTVAAGTRRRYVVRRSDGSLTSKRGFSSETAARDARRRAVEQVVRREVVHTRETFGQHWARWLERRKPYLESGTWGSSCGATSLHKARIRRQAASVRSGCPDTVWKASTPQKSAPRSCRQYFAHAVAARRMSSSLVWLVRSSSGITHSSQPAPGEFARQAVGSPAVMMSALPVGLCDDAPHASCNGIDVPVEGAGTHDVPASVSDRDRGVHVGFAVLPHGSLAARGD